MTTKEKFTKDFEEFKEELTELDKFVKPILRQLKAMGKRADKMADELANNGQLTDFPKGMDICLMFRLSDYALLIERAIQEIEASTWNLEKSTVKKAVGRGQKTFKDPYPHPEDKKRRKEVKTKKHLHADEDDD